MFTAKDVNPPYFQPAAPVDNRQGYQRKSLGNEMPVPVVGSPASSAIVKPGEIWACLPLSATVIHQETLVVPCSGGFGNC